MKESEKNIPALCGNKSDCCGCTSCYSVCPVNAITMEADKEGFLYPHIDEDKCISCNTCVRVCAFKSDIENCTYGKEKSKEDIKVYAVKHKDENVRKLSRSGGVFSALTSEILREKGVIYGCILNENKEAVHFRATTEKERDAMRGSKYVQSDMTGIFKQVRSDLDNDMQVLFSGTSCQIAGLKSFLRKDYENLICIDIVCHGVPSPKVWKDYLEWQEQKNAARCKVVNFRNKVDYGWPAHIETLIMERNDGKKKRVDSRIYTKLFYSHNTLRLSCSKCPYKSIYHPGDITIADYWGINKAAPGFNDNKGVSLVIVNSEKGMKIFRLIMEFLDFCETKIEDSMQQPFIGPFEIPKEREKFWKDYEELTFYEIINKYAKWGWKDNIKLAFARLRYKLRHK